MMLYPISVFEINPMINKCMPKVFRDELAI